MDTATTSQLIRDALVLGHSLKKFGGDSDRVLLVTDQISCHDAANCLARFWKLREIQPVEVASQLISGCRPRFAGVFNKLRVLELEEYRKAGRSLRLLLCLIVYMGPGACSHKFRWNGRCAPSSTMMMRFGGDSS